MTVDERWPTAQLDRVARLRVLAAGLPGVHLHEQVIDADFDTLWKFVADFERTTPLFEPDVSSLRVTERAGDQLRLRVRLPWWGARAPLSFDVTLRDGWCWMVSRPQLYVVGMAAEPVVGNANATVFGHLEGVLLPRSRPVRWLTFPALATSRWRHRHHVPGDVARIAALLRSAGAA